MEAIKNKRDNWYLKTVDVLYVDRYKLSGSFNRHHTFHKPVRLLHYLDVTAANVTL